MSGSVDQCYDHHHHQHMSLDSGEESPSTALTNLNACLQMKSRMESRRDVAASFDENAPQPRNPDRIPSQSPHVVDGGAAAKHDDVPGYVHIREPNSAARVQAVPIDPFVVEATPNERPSSIRNVEGCRTLRDRILDRQRKGSEPRYEAVRPNSSPHMAAAYASAAAASEQVKDVYVHEREFPVNTVLEMGTMRQPTPAHSSRPMAKSMSPPSPSKVAAGSGAAYASFADGTGDNAAILMAPDAAALVNTLEDRLGLALQRVAQLEGTVRDCRAEMFSADDTIARREKENTMLEARNEELRSELKAVRLQCVDTIERERKAQKKGIEDAVKAAKAEWAQQTSELKTTSKSTRRRVEELESENKRLGSLVKELREQLAQNAAALHTNTKTIKELTSDLVAAKQQTSMVSAGYHKREDDIKSFRSQLHDKTSELEQLKRVRESLVKEEERRTKTEYELVSANAHMAKLKDADVERDRLKDVVRKLENDLEEKNVELSKVKGQVEQIRAQAMQAYEHSEKYQQQDHEHDQMMSTLRREIEDEERRIQDEARRWKATSRSAAGTGASPSRYANY